MIKPAKFSDLPHSVQEQLLWDMDLNYCSYESSKDSAIWSILNASSEDYIDSTNRAIIANYYKALSVESLQVKVEGERASLERQLASVLSLLAS